MKKVAINGFGRIGRLIFRQLIKDKDIKIVAINDLTNTKTLAHLLKYDTAQGRYNGIITYNDKNLIVDGQEIRVTSIKDPKALPWKQLKVDIVVESTGFFLTKEAVKAHIDAGAKKVIISAPTKSPSIKTIVYSVNHSTLTPDDRVISAASCTTNALALVANVLEKNFGIVRGFMTTIHAYTGDQSTQDKPHKDLRRSRAGAANFIPTTTGAALSLGKVLPELNGKLDGIAVRGPVITGSLIDLVVELKNTKVTIDKINAAMKDSESSSFGYTEDPIVSSDIIGETHGSIFDAKMSKELVVDGKKLFKLFVWYDNENSYVTQYVKTFKHFVNL